MSIVYVSSSSRDDQATAWNTTIEDDRLFCLVAIAPLRIAYVAVTAHRIHQFDIIQDVILCEFATRTVTVPLSAEFHVWFPVCVHPVL
jgi:hypothetical protein